MLISPARGRDDRPDGDEQQRRHRREGQPPGARGADAAVEQRAPHRSGRAAGRRHEHAESKSAEHRATYSAPCKRRLRSAGATRCERTRRQPGASSSGLRGPGTLSIDAAHQQPDPLDVGLGPGHLAADPPGVDDDDAVGQGEDLLQLAGDQQHGDAPVGGGAQPLADELDRSDVEAAASAGRRRGPSVRRPAHGRARRAAGCRPTATRTGRPGRRSRCRTRRSARRPAAAGRPIDAGQGARPRPSSPRAGCRRR